MGTKTDRGNHFMSTDKRFADLVDFFDRWPEERKKLVSIVGSKKLDPQESHLLETMILIVDRVGPNDLSS